MKTATRSMFTIVSGLLLGATLASPARAADKTYQVTGPVLEVTDNSVTVQKSKEKWQIARTKDTKVTGDLKVGSKVTTVYSWWLRVKRERGPRLPTADRRPPSELILSASRSVVKQWCSKRMALASQNLLVPVFHGATGL